MKLLSYLAILGLIIGCSKGNETDEPIQELGDPFNSGCLLYKFKVNPPETRYHLVCLTEVVVGEEIKSIHETDKRCHAYRFKQDERQYSLLDCEIPKG